jgi:ubiquinone/menaquinone biosynthesis C-methylase UbiE
MSDKNIKVERKEYHRVTATFKFLFPKKDVLCSRLRDSGFDIAKSKTLSMGIVAIHEAWKY